MPRAPVVLLSVILWLLVSRTKLCVELRYTSYRSYTNFSVHDEGYSRNALHFISTFLIKIKHAKEHRFQNILTV